MNGPRGIESLANVALAAYFLSGIALVVIPLGLLLNFPMKTLAINFPGSDLLRRFTKALRRDGPFVVLTTVWHRLLYYRTNHADKSGIEFDQIHGTDTEEIYRPPSSDVVGSNWHHGTRAQSSNPVEFTKRIRSLGIDHREWAFLDLGCGKGRTLLLASQFGFRVCVGVEYSGAAYQTARANVAKWRERWSGEFNLHHADAATFTHWPQGPLVLYMFNPFDAAVMGAIVARAEAHPWPLMVVYRNAPCADLWRNARGFTVVSDIPGELVVRK